MKLTPEKFVGDYIGLVNRAFDVFRKDLKEVVPKIRTAVGVFFLGPVGASYDLILFLESVLGAFFGPVQALSENLALAPARAILEQLASASEEELGIGQSSQYVMTVKAAKAVAVREMVDAALSILRNPIFPNSSNIATVYAVSQRLSGVGGILRLGVEKFIGKKISSAFKIGLAILVNNVFKLFFSISAVTLIYVFWRRSNKWPSLTHGNPREYGTKKGRFHTKP